ncbi:hypothetical protein GE061_010701 [Apolygus lucorum]|uniref:Uncharacterized protein n=1 Tax=Apolygus lucorum TaxID=248454 RepID=A0A6A4JY98_APOLU|nr:hypothetical protein GE061_010701 [Apolygus lucorum]
MQNHSRTNLSVFILYTSILIHGCGCFYSTIRRMDLVKVGPRLESGAVVAEIPVILNNSRTPPSQLNFTLTGDYCFTVDNQGIVSVVGTCLPKMDRGSQVPRQFQVKASLPHFSVPVIVAANLTIVNASCEPSPVK